MTSNLDTDGLINLISIDNVCVTLLSAHVKNQEFNKNVLIHSYLGCVIIVFPLFLNTV